MALRLRVNKDVKKSSYYVWYLGAREAKGVDGMPGAIAYLLERERLQEPFKVTLQVSSKGLKIIQTVHPGGSIRSAVKHLVPGHAVLAAVQREDVVAATLLLPNPATNNPVHVHAYRCDSVETAELLGGQLKALATHADNLAKVSSAESRVRSNLGSDGRSTRESESSEGSGDMRHISPQTAIIYDSLAAELRAKLGGGNSADNSEGPILLPPRDYDTVHRHRGNLTGIELRRCLNQIIVGGNTAIDNSSSSGNNINNNRGGTRSAASSGIGSDSAATPPPYQPHHPLGMRQSRQLRDSSSDDDWGANTEDTDYIGENVTLPRIPGPSPDRVIPTVTTRGHSPNSHQRRRPAELRQRSPSPHQLQYTSSSRNNNSGNNNGDVTSPRERFQDAKEMFRAMEREAIARPIISVARREIDSAPTYRLESKQQQQQQIHGGGGRQVPASVAPLHEHLIRRAHPELMERDKVRVRPRTHHYPPEHHPPEQEISRPRARTSSYETPLPDRDHHRMRSQMINHRDVRDYGDLRRDLRGMEVLRAKGRSSRYQELSEHERYPGLDRESARPPMEIVSSPSRYRHSYAEPLRLGLAALHPY